MKSLSETPLGEMLRWEPLIESPLDPGNECPHGWIPSDSSRPAGCDCPEDGS